MNNVIKLIGNKEKQRYIDKSIKWLDNVYRVVHETSRQ